MRKGGRESGDSSGRQYFRRVIAVWCSAMLGVRGETYLSFVAADFANCISLGLKISIESDEVTS